MPNIQLVAAFLLVAALSYLLGSLNFALVVSRLMGDDIRRHGSGNAGMTNILRTYGKAQATVVAIGDLTKAIVAVTLSRYLFFRVGIVFLDAAYPAGLFVLLGHLFPLYFGFKGGKGVIASLGIILITNPPVFFILVAIFLPVILLTKIVSLGSMLGAAAYPLVTFLVQRHKGLPPLYDTLFAGIMSVIVIVSHRENIKRLLSGTENRFGR